MVECRGSPQIPPCGTTSKVSRLKATRINQKTAVDTDKSGVIDVNELNQAMRNGDWQPYGLDSLYLLMSMFDADKSGTINFNEFQALWK